MNRAELLKELHKSFPNQRETQQYIFKLAEKYKETPEQGQTLPLDNVVGRSEQLKAFAEMVAKDDFAYLKDAETLLKDFESL